MKHFWMNEGRWLLVLFAGAGLGSLFAAATHSPLPLILGGAAVAGTWIWMARK